MGKDNTMVRVANICNSIYYNFYLNILYKKMSQIEHILYKAYNKGIYNETMSIAQGLKQDDPKMEVADRYELAYAIAKRKYGKI